MFIIQVIVLLAIILYVVGSCINIIDNHIPESRTSLNADLMFNIVGAICIFVLLYFCGAFDQIFPKIHVL